MSHTGLGLPTLNNFEKKGACRVTHVGTLFRSFIFIFSIISELCIAKIYSCIQQILLVFFTDNKRNSTVQTTETACSEDQGVDTRCVVYETFTNVYKGFLLSVFRVETSDNCLVCSGR